MYMIRPFPGRINPNGEKEYGGFYCWFACPNEKYTRDYGGGKISFNNYGRTESDEEEERRRNYGDLRATPHVEYAPAPHALSAPAYASVSQAAGGEFARHPPL